MITAGIDIGHQSVNTVILDDETIVSQTTEIISGTVVTAAQIAWEKALSKSALAEDQVDALFATGVGREKVTFADSHPTEMLATVKGAFFLFPGTRTVINVGAEGSRLLKCDELGKLTHFRMNDTCASGAGVFLETVSEMMQVPLADMGPLSLQHTREIALTSTCAVFVESEIIAEIHKGTAKEDILWGVHLSLASQVYSRYRREGIEKELVLTGGVARNQGVVAAINKLSGIEARVPEHPDMIGALGAALLARGKQ